MHDLEVHTCSICGRHKQAHDRWFLLTEAPQEDRLRILEWNPTLAKHDGIPRACCIAHVQELVVHWMAIGSLHHPFAATAPGIQRNSRSTQVVRDFPEIYGGQQIGELSVHRESIRRVLQDSPQSLKTILDAIVDALDPTPEEPEKSFTTTLPIAQATPREV